MKTYSVYINESGEFTGARLRVPPEMLELNLAGNESVIEGEFDHLSHKVDLSTGEVVEFRAARAEIESREMARAAALAQINALESKQARAIREAFLDPTNEAARQRVIDIDNQITELRLKL